MPCSSFHHPNPMIRQGCARQRKHLYSVISVPPKSDAERTAILRSAKQLFALHSLTRFHPPVRKLGMVWVILMAIAYRWHFNLGMCSPRDLRGLDETYVWLGDTLWAWRHNDAIYRELVAIVLTHLRFKSAATASQIFCKILQRAFVRTHEGVRMDYLIIPPRRIDRPSLIVASILTAHGDSFHD